MDVVVLPRVVVFVLGVHGVGVAAFFGEVGESVVEVFCSVSHVEGLWGHDFFAEESGVRVGVESHGVAAHVFDSTCDGKVNKAGFDG